MKNDTPPPDPIAAAVRAEIDRRGMSIRAVAAAAGTSQPVVSRWLTGERDIYLSTLASVLDELGLELHVRRRRTRHG